MFVCASCVARAEKVSVGAGTTDTSVVTFVEPPTPLQVRLNFLTPLVRAGKVSLPETSLVPAKGAPLAEHDVASSLVQVKRTESPGSTRSRSATSSTRGFGKASTVKVCEERPPGPSQTKTNSLTRSVRAAVVTVPLLVLSARYSPSQAPLATQRSASVTLKAIRAVLPTATSGVVVDNEMVGGGVDCAKPAGASAANTKSTEAARMPCSTPRFVAISTAPTTPQTPPFRNR